MTVVFEIVIYCNNFLRRMSSLRQHHQASVQHHKVHLGALPDNGGQLHQMDERHVQGVHRHLHCAAYRALHADQRGQEGTKNLHIDF